MSADEKPSFESVLADLTDLSREIGAKRLAGLSDLDQAEAASLRAAWSTLDDARRRRIIRDLVELAEDNVEFDFDAVFLAALSDAQPEVRRAAIQGLWEHEGRDLLVLLLDLLERDPAAGVRADAALALGRFVLRAEFEGIRASDTELLESTLRQTFHDPTEPVEVRARALESLGARCEDWVSSLIDEAFDSEDRRLRISAVHAMGRSADAAWLSSVLAQLDSDDAEMRFEAATAAGSIGDEEAVPFLTELLHDEDMEVRMAAIMALGEIGGEEAKDALKELQSRGDDRIAEAVADAIAEIEFAHDPLAFDL